MIFKRKKRKNLGYVTNVGKIELFDVALPIFFQVATETVFLCKILRLSFYMKQLSSPRLLNMYV